MFLRRGIAAAVGMLMTGAIEGGVATSAPAALPIDTPSLSAADRARFDRAVEVVTRRYDEWLGASPVEGVIALPRSHAVWSSPPSMALESQVAFVLARARFARFADADGMDTLLDGIAWHLQSRVVAELYDLAHHQPGHHAVEVRLFGDHVRWSVPSVVVSSRARDERADPAISHAAASVATLENIVGWPALAAALRLLASDGPPFHDRDAVAGVLERALAVPLDWFFAVLEPAFRVNFRLASVDARQITCGQRNCYRTTVAVARDGDPPFAEGAGAMTGLIPIRVGFGSESSTIQWTGLDTARSFILESEAAPLDVTVDPAHLVRLDENWLDQRWRADRPAPSPPIRAFAAWLVWLQDAALTYGGLL